MPTLKVYVWPGFILNASPWPWLIGFPGKPTKTGPVNSCACSSGLKTLALTLLRHSFTLVTPTSRSSSKAVNSIPPSEVAFAPTPTARTLSSWPIFEKGVALVDTLRSVLRTKPNPPCASTNPLAPPDSDPDRASMPPSPVLLLSIRL